MMKKFLFVFLMTAMLAIAPMALADIVTIQASWTHGGAPALAGFHIYPVIEGVEQPVIDVTDEVLRTFQFDVDVTEPITFHIEMTAYDELGDPPDIKRESDRAASLPITLVPLPPGAPSDVIIITVGGSS